MLAQVKILLELVKDLRETAQSESFKVDKLTRQLEKVLKKVNSRLLVAQLSIFDDTFTFLEIHFSVA